MATITEFGVICDRCGEELSASASSIDEAFTMLKNQVAEKGWTLKGTSSPSRRDDRAKQDLCNRCSAAQQVK